MPKLKNDVTATKRTSAANIENEEKNMHQAMITEAAYFMAEKRGFATGHEMDDWLEAEKKIMENTAQ